MEAILFLSAFFLVIGVIGSFVFYREREVAILPMALIMAGLGLSGVAWSLTYLDLHNGVGKFAHNPYVLVASDTLSVTMKPGSSGLAIINIGDSLIVKKFAAPVPDRIHD